MLETPQIDQPPDTPPPDRGQRWRIWALAGAVAIAVVLTVLAAVSGPTTQRPGSAIAVNPSLDPGTAMDRPAPGFTLTDERGRPVSLRDYRGRVVILAFNDSQCTTICPLTTTAMVDATRSLGPAASKVQLLGIDANPRATATADVLRYTQVHGLLGQWHFLTGSLRQLRAVWKAYGIGVEIQRGQIDHTPALFMVDPQGRLRRVYLTQQSYAAIPQFGQLLAQEASRLLPGHPAVRSHYSYSQVKGVAPTQTAQLPRVGGGRIRLGPGAAHSPGAAHLYLFFATWDRQITPLARELELLDGYQRLAGRAHLPALTAVDEGPVEPSSSALPQFLRRVRLSYPVAIDSSGRVADGYGVQDQPWLVLTSASGHVAWYRDVSVSGWPNLSTLQSQVRAALARPPKRALGPAGASQALAGSPAPLAALHRQASVLLGSAPALVARARSLHGYPVVVNVWASWCGPCQAEFGLLSSASARYGRQVAFLGADVNDSRGDAQAFLRQHQVSYPSYGLPLTAMQEFLPQGVIGLPTTFFISPAGKVVSVHTGQYDSQGTLDQDIQTYALGH